MVILHEHVDWYAVFGGRVVLTVSIQQAGTSSVHRKCITGQWLQCQGQGRGGSEAGVTVSAAAEETDDETDDVTVTSQASGCAAGDVDGLRRPSRASTRRCSSL